MSTFGITTMSTAGVTVTCTTYSGEASPPARARKPIASLPAEPAA